MSKILGIDGNSIMNRAFYGIMGRNIMRTSTGIFTNALYGFLSILNKTIDDYNPDYICVAFDLKAPTFRHQKYEEYKGTRKPMPDELRMQMPLIKDVLNAMNIKILELEGYEADDILGTIALIGEKEADSILLLTGDRDYLQLVSNKVTVRIPTTKQGQTEYTDYTPEVVKEKFNIEPSQFIEIKGLMGDTSDNIPGIPGVGEKTAFSLIEKYHDIDTIYSLVEQGGEVEGIKGKLREKVEANKDLAYLSKDLGTIFREVPLDVTIDDLKKQEVNNDDLYNLFIKLQFKNYIEKYKLTQPTGENAIQEESVASYEEKEYKEEAFVAAIINRHNDTKTVSTYYYDNNALAVIIDDTIYYASNPSVDDLKVYFESDISKISYDVKQTYIELNRFGIVPKHLDFDIKIASYILNPSKNKFGLEDIILEELGILVDQNKKKEPEQISLLGMSNDNKENDKEEKEKSINYAKYIEACKNKLEAKLKSEEEYKLFKDIEMPFRIVLARMQIAGVLVDKSTLEEYQKTLTVKVNALNDEIMEMAGENFNVNSPKQLGHILFEVLGIYAPKKTKSGYSTDAETLDKIREDHPIVEKILEYRTLAKLKSTYADGLLPLVKEDGRIHASFNQTVTATGRISCSDPNLQNIPIRTEVGREFRKVFVAPKGYKFIDADYSQIELRVLAHVSNDDTMIKGFKDGQDIHAITASQVFEIPLDKVTKQQRSEAKAVNFGIVYGISDFGLGANIGISRKKAKIYIQKYFEKYPGIHNFMKMAVEECRVKGYSETLWGRRRYVPEINAKNFNVRQGAERIAMNTPIQGSAADIIKIAMVNVQKKLDEENLNTRLVLQVHDELVLESPDSEVEIAKEILVNEMQNVAKLKVPLIAEAEVGENWYEAH
ncbi:MAG: DNA polymerase I [Clostridia bacterium]|nr:DNA polymerase I [Clostridia bacterium]